MVRSIDEPQNSRDLFFYFLLIYISREADASLEITTIQSQSLIIIVIIVTENYRLFTEVDDLGILL